MRSPTSISIHFHVIYGHSNPFFPSVAVTFHLFFVFYCISISTKPYHVMYILSIFMFYIGSKQQEQSYKDLALFTHLCRQYTHSNMWAYVWYFIWLNVLLFYKTKVRANASIWSENSISIELSVVTSMLINNICYNEDKRIWDHANNYFLSITEPSPLYDNNHYHEECLRCNSCGLNLTGPNQKRARRFKVSLKRAKPIGMALEIIYFRN